MRSAFYSEKARSRQFGTDAPEFSNGCFNILSALVDEREHREWEVSRPLEKIMRISVMNHDYKHTLASRRADKQQYRHDEEPVAAETGGLVQCLDHGPPIDRLLVRDNLFKRQPQGR
jgi:hypothetical protein